MAKHDEYGLIAELEDNEIFVFGSNGFGAHNGGAAATAVHISKLWQTILLQYA